MKNNSKCYFIISCARSGSTSLCHILDTASNGKCLMEPAPNLNIETRDFMEGKISNPRAILVETVFPRIARVLDEGYIYGEKNVTLGPFIPYLHEILKCKFVFLKRDGRDVVTSLLNWHNEAFGNIYRECNETNFLSKIAHSVVEKLPSDQDTSDYARPRPGSSDPFFHEWPNFSRFEMVTWYWSYINQLFWRNIQKLPKEDWIELNYTDVKARDIHQVFDFLSLEGFNASQTEEMLNSRINSVWTRFNIKPRFPSWQDWSKNQVDQFNRIAGETMELLGYSSK